MDLIRMSQRDLTRIAVLSEVVFPDISKRVEHADLAPPENLPHPPFR